MLSKLDGPLLQISAVDFFTVLSPSNAFHMDMDVISNSLDHAVLARRSLSLKVGAHVILIASCTSKHPLLSKGVTGQVVQLLTTPIVQVRVRFILPKTYDVVIVDLQDDIHFTTMITHNGLHLLLTRRSLPLVLSWALTIHASKGLTLPVSKHIMPFHVRTFP